MAFQKLLLLASYPSAPPTTPYAPPPFPNILLKSPTRNSGFSQAAKCPPFEDQFSNTKVPSVRAHAFGTPAISCGNCVKPRGTLVHAKNALSLFSPHQLGSGFSASKYVRTEAPGPALENQ